MTVESVVAFVKSVPLGGAALVIEDGMLTRHGVTHGMDPINEVALEWALQARERGAIARVIACTMGPVDAESTLRRAIAMGCDEALLVADPALVGADVRETARVLATAAARVGPKLAVFGNESADGSSGSVPAAVAALLDWPIVSLARAADLDGTRLRCERDLGTGPGIVECEMPAVISFTPGATIPRLPTLRDVARARSATIARMGLAELGLTCVASATRELSVRLEHVPLVARATAQLGLGDGVEAVVRLLTDVGIDRG